jgi:fatty acid desaturase
MSAVATETKLPSIQDPTVKAKIKSLCTADNWTNAWYLLRTWVYLIAVVGGTMYLFARISDGGYPRWWNVPVALVAIILVGAGQHQLTGLAHEASHSTLFKNKKVNDLASDFLCMFPMFSTTHHYRLQHIAHHQFTNDPERDPDVSQLKTSGHWLPFPLLKKEFVRTVLKQLWVPTLIRYMRIRAMYNAVGTDKNPYLRSNGQPTPKTAIRTAIFYLLGLVVALGLLTAFAPWPVLIGVPILAGVGIVAFYWRLPDNYFRSSRIRTIFTPRQMTMMRMAFFTLFFSSIAWAARYTGRPIYAWMFLLWVVPIFTSFSFFMVLRQLVQHGNADRGWLTNTRTFFVNPLIRFAVFPMGQDYHLPHHMYASVPHFKLKELHDTLMETEEYRTEATVVEGYFFPPVLPPRNPTVLDVVGPEYAGHKDEIHLDHTVLESVEVEGKEELLALGSGNPKSG